MLRTVFAFLIFVQILTPATLYITRVKLNQDKSVLYFYSDSPCTGADVGKDCLRLVGDHVSITSSEIKNDVLSIIIGSTWTSGHDTNFSRIFKWANGEKIHEKEFVFGSVNIEYEPNITYCVYIDTVGYLLKSSCYRVRNAIKQFRIGTDPRSIFDVNVKKLDNLREDDNATIREVTEILELLDTIKVNRSRCQDSESGHGSSQLGRCDQTIDILFIVVILFCAVVTIHVVQECIKVHYLDKRAKVKRHGDVPTFFEMRQ